MFSRFDTILECHRRTDRQMDRGHCYVNTGI